MPEVAVGGRAIHYETAGAGGPTLCLIHGSGGSAGVWIRQMEGLADVARMIALDLPGHGDSDGDGIGTVQSAAEVVHGLLDALRIERAIVGGHSMGGAIALAFALAHPDRLSALVLVGTGARLRVAPKIFETLERDYGEGVRFVVDLAVSGDAPPELRRALARQTLANPRPVMIGDFRACDAFDVMDRVDQIRVPALVVCGDEDQLTPPKYARYLAGRIAGARLRLVPGAGHYVQIERPDETTEAIRELIASPR